MDVGPFNLAWTPRTVGDEVTVDSGDLQELGFSITFAGNQAVLGVGGEIDLLSAPEFAGILDGIIDRGHVSVVLNVAEVTFMAAAGLGVIASAAGRLGLLGGELVLRSPSAMVARLLDVTGLAAVVRVEKPGSLDRLGPEQSRSFQGVAGHEYQAG
jgi:anti-sigma B factor antagonist